jgi:hypothetical protein
MGYCAYLMQFLAQTPAEFPCRYGSGEVKSQKIKILNVRNVAASTLARSRLKGFL